MTAEPGRHAAGDRVLQEISKILVTVVRSTDVLVRWGGEEFAIILPQTSLPQATSLAERIRSCIEGLQITTSGKTINVTVSLGVAQKSDDTMNFDALFHLADHQLYRAKQSGRNQVCV